MFRARTVLGSIVSTAAVVLLAAQAAVGAHADRVIVLPGASSTEGIARGAGTTFYATDLFAGDVFRGDLRTGAVERFIDNPPGRLAVGLKADVPHGLLFVAGGLTGQGYVYDLDTGASLATYQLAPAGAFINDVAVTRTGAWFTNSNAAELYFVPASHKATGPVRTLPLTGPAADTSGQFNSNGIAATADGTSLLVAHSGQGAVNLVDPTTGASRTLSGVATPNVDGILLEGRTLWAVQNFSNQISQFQLSGDLSAGSLTKVITSDAFQVPTTVARFGDRLAVVNAKFDTGLPPTASEYEVVVVDR
jgi:sugar lactone lactonase YvrE